MKLAQLLKYPKLVPAVGLAFSLCVQSATATDLIINGGFESGPGGTPTLHPGSTLLTGWTIVTGGIDVVQGFQTHGGTLCVDLDGYFETGALSQTVNVAVGQSYLLSFWLAGNPQGGPSVKQMDASWGGVSLGGFTFDTTGKSISNMGWTLHQVQVQATSPQMTLVFASLDSAGSAYGACIDDVSLTAVPEPTSFALVGLGTSVMLLMRRRK